MESGTFKLFSTLTRLNEKKCNMSNCRQHLMMLNYSLQDASYGRKTKSIVFVGFLPTVGPEFPDQHEACKNVVTNLNY